MNAPDLTASLTDLLGWSRDGKLPPGLELSEQAKQRFDDDARRMARLAATSEGQWLMDLLMELTVRRSPINLGLGGEDAREFAARRFGQNQVMAAIAFYLNHAADLEQDEHDRRNRPDRDDLPDPAGWGQPARGGGADDPDPGFDPGGLIAVR